MPLLSKSNQNEDKTNNKYVLYWNISAALTVLLPLFMFCVASLVGDGEGGDDGGEGEGWWASLWERRQGEGWWWGGEQAPENQGKGATIFAYLWSLIVFGALVLLGNRVLNKQKDLDLMALFVGLVSFTNLAFLCAIFASSNAARGNERQEGSWLGQFSACVVLTFVFWTLFGLVYSVIMYRNRQVNKVTSEYMKEGEAFCGSA